jgi:hypothetical protein
MTRLHLTKLGLSTLLLIVPARDSAGQTWLHLPNGEVGYVVDYTTTGIAFCSKYFLSGSCSVSGSSFAIRNGGSTMTVTFEGVTDNVIASNQATKQVRLGTIKTAISGSGTFQFPQTAAPNGPYMYFAILLDQLSPTFSQKYIAGGYLLRSGGLRPFQYSSVASFPTLSPPAGAAYGEYSFGQVLFPDLPPVDGEYDVMASVNLTPEPATLALVGSGMLAFAGISLRRRRDHSARNN